MYVSRLQQFYQFCQLVLHSLIFIIESICRTVSLLSETITISVSIVAMHASFIDVLHYALHIDKAGQHPCIRLIFLFFRLPANIHTFVPYYQNLEMVCTEETDGITVIDKGYHTWRGDRSYSGDGTGRTDGDRVKLSQD